MSQINSEVKALFINGQQVPLTDGSFSASLGGQEVTSVMGSGRRLGGAEANQPGGCSFEVVYTKGLQLRALLDVRDAQIRVVWNRGAEWLMTAADLQSPLNISAPEGRVTVSYEGDAWVQTKD